jgi:hypothetical protein
LGIPGGPVKKKIDKHLFDSNGPYYWIKCHTKAVRSNILFLWMTTIIPP